MNLFTLVVVLSVSVLTATEPYRPRRSSEEVIQLNTSTASNDTVPIQEAVLTNSTLVQNTTLEFKAPVVEKIVENNTTNSSSTNLVYFSFIGDQDSTVNCTYNYTSSLVSCQGPTEFVVCNTTVDFGHLNQLSFDVASIGLIKFHRFPQTVYNLPRYKIFPFKLVSNNTDSTIVYEYKYPIYGYEISFMNRHFYGHGFRKFDCINQLIALLHESKLLQGVIQDGAVRTWSRSG